MLTSADTELTTTPYLAVPPRFDWVGQGDRKDIPGLISVVKDFGGNCVDHDPRVGVIRDSDCVGAACNNVHGTFFLFLSAVCSCPIGHVTHPYGNGRIEMYYVN